MKEDIHAQIENILDLLLQNRISKDEAVADLLTVVVRADIEQKKLAAEIVLYRLHEKMKRLSEAITLFEDWAEGGNQ